QSDMETIRTNLQEIGGVLGYQVGIQDTELQPIKWMDQNTLSYTYYVITSAVIGKILKQVAATEGILCLVIPGGRAGLVSYKLDRDPVLNELSLSWQFLKFRQVRATAGLSNITREDWRSQFGADPVTNSEQMRLF
ncbi:MAG: hypothetical protein ACK2TS_02475, partial [Anaerolineales bacterium]